MKTKFGLSKSMAKSSLRVAIRQFHGLHHGHPDIPPESIKWAVQPQPDKMERIKELLPMVGVADIETAVKEIEAFKKVDDFNDWMNKI